MVDPAFMAVLMIALSAAIVQGTVGFGFVLLAAPLLSIFIDPRLVVPIVLVQTLFTSVPILVHAYRDVRLSRMWLMALAAIAGVPLGTYILLVLDEEFLKMLIGLVVAATSLLMMFGYSKSFRRERLASVPVGFASGALGASTGLAGPPVIFFYTNQQVHPREFRANIVAYFTVLDLVVLPWFMLSGVFTSETFALSAQLLPATLVGVLGGIVLNRWVRELLFRRIALLLMVIAGIVALVSGLTGL